MDKQIVWHHHRTQAFVLGRAPLCGCRLGQCSVIDRPFGPGGIVAIVLCNSHLFVRGRHGRALGGWKPGVLTTVLSLCVRDALPGTALLHLSSGEHRRRIADHGVRPRRDCHQYSLRGIAPRVEANRRPAATAGTGPPAVANRHRQHVGFRSCTAAATSNISG